MPQTQLFAVKALFFDVFGTLVDWRTSIAREAKTVLEPLGHKTDWLGFADAWRDEYQPGMEDVRAGRIPFSKLDLLHRRNLDRILPRFGFTGLSGEVTAHLNRAWHRLDGWADVAPGLHQLRRKFLLAPVSNGNISLMVDLARRNGFPWDAILGAEVAGDYINQSISMFTSCSVFEGWLLIERTDFLGVVLWLAHGCTDLGVEIRFVGDRHSANRVGFE